MPSNLELSVILPSYLEEENLRILLPRLKATLDTLSVPYEVLIVDTVRPMDNTRAVCESQGVAYLPRQGGNDYGDAIRTGIQAARGRYLLFMDADGSHAPEFIPQLYREASQNDVVIASRYIDGGVTENSLPLVLMSRVLNVSYALILGLKCKDVSNSFKIYRADLIKPVATYCKNFDIIEEIIFKMKRSKKDLRIKEVPFTFKKRMFGDTKRNLALFIVTYIFTMLKLRFGR